ncbi:hypothetical protein HO710_09690 [Streptococcus suis]|nr:hypothetical protein [Streptococcus suis]
MIVAIFRRSEECRRSKTGWTEVDNEEKPLSALTMEELELFEEFALLNYKKPT